MPPGRADRLLSAVICPASLGRIGRIGLAGRRIRGHHGGVEQIRRPERALLLAAVGGGLLSVGLGVFGFAHDPDIANVPTLGFGNVIRMKVWLALVVGVLALCQLVSALWMYGKLGRPAPPWLGTVHRVTGLAALLVSLPVAFACLYGIGFYTGDLRVILHSAAGCLLYGAFVVKVAGLHTRGPGWLVPVAGGTVFTLLVLIVLTSAGWYLSSKGLPSGY